MFAVQTIPGITGDELLTFINNEEAALPGGKKGAGLFRYRRSGDSRGLNRDSRASCSHSAFSRSVTCSGTWMRRRQSSRHLRHHAGAGCDRAIAISGRSACWAGF